MLEETEPGGETALAPLWHELAAHQIRRRGLVVILSDCFDDLHRLMLALQHFRHQQHEVLLFHILAPEEIDFPFTKRTQFQKPGSRRRSPARRSGPAARGVSGTLRRRSAANCAERRAAWASTINWCAPTNRSNGRSAPT